MKRHKWVKKGKKPWVYWECQNCGCTKQKDWGLPWFYFPSDSESTPVFKSPLCKAVTEGGEG